MFLPSRTILVVLGLSTLLLTRCTPPLPDHRAFAGMQSRSELLGEFGEPEAIRASVPMLDVASLNESASVFDTTEEWVYSSIRDGSQGKTMFHFLYSKQTGRELLTGQGWLSNSAYGIRENSPTWSN